MTTSPDARRAGGPAINPTLDRWLDALKVLAAFAVVCLASLVVGEPGIAAAQAAMGLVVAWVFSPLSRVGPHTPQAALDRVVEDDDVVVYWRPGCSVCLALLARLDRDQRAAAVWVNVVRDAAAAGVVRHHRDGDMVTPTAVTAAGEQVTADAATLGPLLTRS